MSASDWAERPGNDMKDAWKQDAILIFKKAIAECQTETEIAQAIKTAFDTKRSSGVWHCVVGKSYGSSVVYEENTHMCQQIGPFMIELWCCGKQK